MYTPDAKTNFFPQERSYSRLNHQNVWKKKEIEKKKIHTPDAKTLFSAGNKLQ